jgi:hypothetical protein
MSEHATMITAGHVPTKGAGNVTSEWSERAGRYAAVAVANAEVAHTNSIERRLDKPSHTWTAGEVVRSYRTTAEGELRYQEEADVLMHHGYRRWLETAPAGHPLGGRILMDVRSPGINVSGERGSRTRIVTWTKGSAT